MHLIWIRKTCAYISIYVKLQRLIINITRVIITVLYISVHIFSKNYYSQTLLINIRVDTEEKVCVIASVNSSCAQPPGLTPPGISIFFVLDGKFPEVGTLKLSNPPGWGRKKRANAPSPINTVTFFIDRTVKIMPF